jgi:CRP-like cAMP-binding protein
MLISTYPTKDNSSFFSFTNSKDKLSTLKSGKHLIRCKRKNLYKQGEQLSQLFYLISGKVILHKTASDGRITRLPQLSEGTFFGLNALFDFCEVNHSATIKNNSLLLVIPIVEFKDLLNRWPNLKRQIICQLINQLDLTEREIYE